jgi:molybdopterin-binding protein
MYPLLSLRQITKKYGETTALKEVNLEIWEKDILSLIGPNGAGKTTLLKIMAGIETPTSGEILYKNKQIPKNNLDLIRQKCTMVFQKTVVFNTTVYENVAYGLKIRGVPEFHVKTKVSEALELVRLKGYEERLAKRLSGGEQQRIALARAIVLEPEILLLDEPTANLDPKTASIIEETVNHMNREKGTTIILATHNMLQAQKIAKKAALLLNGEIKETDAIENVFLTPSLIMANLTGVENIFMGNSKPTNEGTSLIDLGDNVTIEAAIQKTGKVTVFIKPEDIIVSRKPLQSSARNMLKGRITEVSDFGPIVKLKVDVGKIFTVQVTKRSFKEMKLTVGAKVFLAFKASSIQLT